MRAHALHQRVPRLVHERRLTERHLVGPRREASVRLNRARIALAAHLAAALHVHRHLLLLREEADHAHVGANALAEHDVHAEILRKTRFEVGRTDDLDKRLLHVYFSRALRATTWLRREHERVRRSALASARAQHDPGVKQHLVLLVAHQRHVVDLQGLQILAKHHVRLVRHVHRHRGRGVVRGRTKLDGSDAQMHSRAERDRDHRLQRDIGRSEGRGTLSGNDVRSNVYQGSEKQKYTLNGAERNALVLEAKSGFAQTGSLHARQGLNASVVETLGNIKNIHSVRLENISQASHNGNLQRVSTDHIYATSREFGRHSTKLV